MLEITFADRNRDSDRMESDFVVWEVGEKLPIIPCALNDIHYIVMTGKEVQHVEKLLELKFDWRPVQVIYGLFAQHIYGALLAQEEETE